MLERCRYWIFALFTCYMHACRIIYMLHACMSHYLHATCMHSHYLHATCMIVALFTCYMHPCHVIYMLHACKSHYLHATCHACITKFRHSDNYLSRICHNNCVLFIIELIVIILRSNVVWFRHLFENTA